jgi:hypothetical protein
MKSTAIRLPPAAPDGFYEQEEEKHENREKERKKESQLTFAIFAKAVTIRENKLVASKSQS